MASPLERWRSLASGNLEMPRPPKSAEAKKDQAKKAVKPSAASVNKASDLPPRALPSKAKEPSTSPKDATKTPPKSQINTKPTPGPATSSSEKKRKAEQSDEPKKAPRLEASSSPATSVPKKSAGDSAKKPTATTSTKPKTTKKPSGLDSIVLTKEQKKATPLSSLPVIPAVDEAKTLELPAHPYVDVNQVLKGANALSAHVKKVAKEAGKKSLFEAEDTIYLIVTLNKIPIKRKVRPTRLPLPNSLYGDDCEICILVKDPQKEFKEKYVAKELPNVKKVIGVSKLRDNYGQFENRRQLLRSYDLFLCDDRVTLLMPGLLGKPFMKSKRMPIAIAIKDKDDIGSDIAKARDSTYLHLPTGTTANVRIAMTTHSAKQIVENVMASIDKIAASFSMGWGNIRAMSLKTSESVALPIYNKLPTLSLPKKKSEKAVPAQGAKQAEGAEKPSTTVATQKSAKPSPAKANVPTPKAKGKAKEKKD